MIESPDFVEVGFSEPIYEDSDRLYVLEGRIDLLGSLQGLNCVIDHKFQFRKRDLYRKTIQFRNYAMIIKRPMLIANYVGLTKKVDKDTFRRVISSFTAFEHNAWKQRLIRMFDKMAEAISHEYYEQRWSACPGKFGHECQFTTLCEESNSQLIEIKKATMFKQRAEWKPW
jgi:hypothetical protein